MKVLIIEDEELALKNLQGILERYGGIQVVATLESITETIDWFSEHDQPDVLFLDIHLADGNAFNIFERIQIKCPVIFTTAYDEYAIKAFTVNSIDYLLKPIDASSVARALQKLENVAFRSNASNEIYKLLEVLKPAAIYKTNFLVPVKGDKLVPVHAGNIAVFYIESGVVKLKSFNDQIFNLELTLDELVCKLNPKEFFRANRQFIISKSAIRDIDLWFNNRLSINLKVSTPERILVSKARISEFKDWFSEG